MQTLHSQFYDFPRKNILGEKYEDLNSTASLILNFSAYIAFVVAKKCKESQIEQQDEKKKKKKIKTGFDYMPELYSNKV